MAFDAATYEIDPLTLTTPKARLEYLRDFLRRLPEERFDMARPGVWADAEHGWCGSAACVAGWARAIFRVTWDERKAHPDMDAIEALNLVGALRLGLSDATATALFWPGNDVMGDGRAAYIAKPNDAADVLDHLIRTGRVDWSVARQAEPS